MKISLFYIYYIILSISILSGNLFRVGIPFLEERSFPITFIDINSIFLCTISFYFMLLKYKNRLVISTPLKFYLLWIFIGVISLVVNSIFLKLNLKEFLYAMSYSMRYLSFIIISILLINLKPTLKYKQKSLNIFIYTSFILSVIGLIQYFTFSNLTDLWSVLISKGIYIPNPDPHVNRIVSTFLDPNFYASFIVMPIFLALDKFVNCRSIRNALILLTVSISFLLTFSRSGILCIIISFISIITIISIKKRNNGKNIKIFIGLFILLIMLYLLDIFLFNNYIFNRITQRFSFASTGGLDPSAEARIFSWERGIEVFLNHPFMGVGYNNYGNYVKYNYQFYGESTLFGNDSSLMLILSTTGIIGSLIFLIGYILMIKEHFNMYMKKNKLKSLLFAGYLIGLFVSSFFNNLLTYPAILCELFILYPLLRKA
ncbi:MAG: O-antigen ligase family protein [Bacillota bacterium]